MKEALKRSYSTDTLQTTFTLGPCSLCYLYTSCHEYGFWYCGFNPCRKRDTQNIFTDPGSKLFFVKQNPCRCFYHHHHDGMDQEMMQKTISVKTLKDSQRISSRFHWSWYWWSFYSFPGRGLLHLYGHNFCYTASGDNSSRPSHSSSCLPSYRSYYHCADIGIVPECRRCYHGAHLLFLYWHSRHATQNRLVGRKEKRKHASGYTFTIAFVFFVL